MISWNIYTTATNHKFKFKSKNCWKNFVISDFCKEIKHARPPASAVVNQTIYVESWMFLLIFYLYLQVDIALQAA